MINLLWVLGGLVVVAFVAFVALYFIGLWIVGPLVQLAEWWSSRHPRLHWPDSGHYEGQCVCGGKIVHFDDVGPGERRSADTVGEGCEMQGRPWDGIVRRRMRQGKLP